MADYDRIIYCDIVECCKECPRYGDDCDGDKRNDGLISRADAIEAVCGVVIDEFDVSPTKGYEVSEHALSALPSAEGSLKAIKRQIDEHWYLDAPSAEVAPKIDHDRDWIIGCLEHDGFIHTDRFDKANQIIHDALSAEAVQRWIPCSERLPEESGTHLTTTAKGSVCTDHFYANSNDICGRHWSYHRRREPIAWMPLPKPYKGGEEE